MRILIPERSDNPLVDLSAWSYAMLENDFARSRRVTAADLHSRSLAFRFAVRAARLTAPVQ